MDKKITCPITMEPIIHGGMTCYGNIYEYDAIKEWFEKHDTDPVSNLNCPSKFIVKVNINSNDLETRQKDMRLTTELIFPITKQWTTVKNIYQEYLQHQKNINKIPQDKFDEYQRRKRNYYCDEDNRTYYNRCGHVEKDDTDIFYKEYHIRDFDFVDLSNILLRNKNFKSQPFIFTNLSGSTFINCDFSRCIFIGCDMRGVKFVTCRFIGEEVCFYKSDCKNMIMIKCKMEPIDRWLEISDVTELAKILPQRKVTGQIVIDKVESIDIIRIN